MELWGFENQLYIEKNPNSFLAIGKGSGAGKGGGKVNTPENTIPSQPDILTDMNMSLEELERHPGQRPVFIHHDETSVKAGDRKKLFAKPETVRGSLLWYHETGGDPNAPDTEQEKAQIREKVTEMQNHQGWDAKDGTPDVFYFGKGDTDNDGKLTVSFDKEGKATGDLVRSDYDPLTAPDPAETPRKNSSTGFLDPMEISTRRKEEEQLKEKERKIKNLLDTLITLLRAYLVDVVQVLGIMMQLDALMQRLNVANRSLELVSAIQKFNLANDKLSKQLTEAIRGTGASGAGSSQGVANSQAKVEEIRHTMGANTSMRETLTSMMNESLRNATDAAERARDIANRIERMVMAHSGR